MVWGNGLGLLFFIWLPIFIAIYFYRHQPKVHRVSSHFLFRQVLKSPRPKSVLEKFIENSLFWIQLLLFILLFLGLSKPLFIVEETGNDVIIIIDNSASMAAKDSSGISRSQTRLDRAINVAREWLSNRKARSVEVYAWNRKILLKQSLKSSPFIVAPIVQTHFKNSTFENLYQFSISKREQGMRILVVTDSMDLFQQQYLEKASVEFKLVAESSDNLFIQEFEKRDIGKQGGKIRVKVGRSGDVASAKVVISGEKGVLGTSSLKFANLQSKWVEIDCGSSEEQDLQVIVTTDGRDVLSEDNQWTLPRGAPQLRIALNREVVSRNPILARLIDSDPRLIRLTGSGNADLKMEKTQSVPQVPEPFHIYLQQSTAIKRKTESSHLVDNTSRFTRFLQGAVLEPASWNSIVSGTWVPLVVSISAEGDQVVVLAIHKIVPSFYWNLSMKAENFHELGLPVVWENFVREWLKLRGLSSILEVGDPMSGFRYSGIETSSTEELALLYPQDFFYSGRFSRTNSGESVFVRIPAVESDLGPVHSYSSLPHIDSNPNAAKMSTGIELLPYLLMGALILLAIEWTIYCRGV